MDEIRDPKIRFYLKHQSDIEEWASIKQEALQLVDPFFESVVRDLSDRAVDAEGKPGLWRPDPEDDFPKVGFYLEHWLMTEGEPKALICFEWERGRSDFRGGYAGINGCDEAVRRDLKSRLGPGSSELHWLAGSWEKAGWWPAKRIIVPPDGYWDKLPEFRSEIASEVVNWWAHCWKLVDQVVTENSS